MNFKKGDIVRCINVKYNSGVTLNTIYIINSVDSIQFKDWINLSNYNRISISNGYFPHRFIKVEAKDLTKKEIFEITKFKLGIKENN